MMQHRFHIFARLCAVWMLCGIFSVNAMSQVSQPAAWRTTPTLSADMTPSYQFRSTSSYTPVVGTTSYLSTSSTVYAPGTSGPYRAKKDEWGNPDEDLPIGVLPTTPVGEPLILVLFGLLMVVYKAVYKKKRVA